LGIFYAVLLLCWFRVGESMQLTVDVTGRDVRVGVSRMLYTIRTVVHVDGVVSLFQMLMVSDRPMTSWIIRFFNA